jgi:hypothetical protein
MRDWRGERDDLLGVKIQETNFGGLGAVIAYGFIPWDDLRLC